MATVDTLSSPPRGEERAAESIQRECKSRRGADDAADVVARERRSISFKKGSQRSAVIWVRKSLLQRKQSLFFKSLFNLPSCLRTFLFHAHDASKSLWQSVFTYRLFLPVTDHLVTLYFGCFLTGIG